jgi:large subunit ribosomal protein L15
MRKRIPLLRRKKETIPIEKPKIAAKSPVDNRKKKEQPARESIDSIGLHNLKVPRGARRHKKLLGRGPSSGHGKTSSRGSKGQTSRAGRDFYLGFEGGQTPIIRRIPKRGFTNPFKLQYQIVNLGDLSRIKESAINLDLLEKEGLIKDKNKLVKVLGDGEIKNAVAIQAHAFSKKAQEKIQGAGGKIELISLNAERTS